MVLDALCRILLRDAWCVLLDAWCLILDAWCLKGSTKRGRGGGRPRRHFLGPFVGGLAGVPASSNKPSSKQQAASNQIRGCSPQRFLVVILRWDFRIPFWGLPKISNKTTRSARWSLYKKEEHEVLKAGVKHFTTIIENYQSQGFHAVVTIAFSYLPM